MTPVKSDDLTEIIDESDGMFVVLRSPKTAGHSPDYYELARFATRQLAEVYLRRH
jgi:hypothetical protein